MSNQYERYMEDKLNVISKRKQNYYLDSENYNYHNYNGYNNTNNNNYNSDFNNKMDENNEYQKYIEYGNSGDIDTYKEISLLKELYPKIYNELYPFVDRICNKHKSEEITNELVSKMSTEIYNEIASNIDNTNKLLEKQSTILRGSKNNFLSDLITIILIDQLIQNCKHGKNNCHKMKPMNYCSYDGCFYNRPMYYNSRNFR